jgi:exopolyphosphatase/guanosine-5'-triphosphate,3'-diphosphate pyrophosphatase
LIIGEQFEPLRLNSLKMGCVSISRACFDDGRITEARLREAELMVRLRLEPVEEEYRERGWQAVIGASGTIKAIQEVITREGWGREGITLEALRRLRGAVLELGNIATLAARWQLEPARARVFPGGFMVLHGLCEVLQVKQMAVSDGALREGVIYDLLGRIRHEDVRDRTIATVTGRYGLDEAQAERVWVTARELLGQAQTAWGLEREEWAQRLEWVARLHEVGLLLTHDQHHKHGAYILEHADLPGFSRGDQTLLAALVRRHRRSVPVDAFAHLPREIAPLVERLCVLLRLAVVLHRGRSRQTLPPLKLSVNAQRVSLRFPSGWLDEHPLTRADLETEARYLKKSRFRLSFG